MRDLVPYLNDLMRKVIDALPSTELGESPEILQRDNHYGRLSFALRYSDGSTLHARLWVDCSGDWPQWSDYSFHYEGADGKLRFRYDNARHHAELTNFPHHLHQGSGEVLPDGPPALRDLTNRIASYLLSP